MRLCPKNHFESVVNNKHRVWYRTARGSERDGTRGESWSILPFDFNPFMYTRFGQATTLVLNPYAARYRERLGTS